MTIRPSTYTWNRKTEPVKDDAFRRGPHLEDHTLGDLVRLDEPAYAAEFRPTVRGAAAWSLGRAASAKGLRALVQARAREAEPSVRQKIENALSVSQRDQG